ncbi:MAG TPA: tetratricopeptide repeat protein [Oculatellaceae cyanobacterium]
MTNRKHSRSILFNTATVCLTALASWINIPASAAEPMDGAVVGAWETTNPSSAGIVTVTLKINGDGTFSQEQTPVDDGDRFGVSGNASFSKGQCRLEAVGRVETGQYFLPDPDHIVINSLLGTAKWKRATNKDSVKQSTPATSRAIEHNNRGVTLGMQGDWNMAIKEHDEALMDEPTNGSFRTNLSAAHMGYGQHLLKNGDYKQAEKEFRKALCVDPLNATALEGLNDSMDKQSGAPKTKH